MSSIDKKAFGISDSLVNAVNEALKGGQVKLDKNHNGKIDGQDFKMLRKEEVVDEGNPMNKAKKNAAVAAVGAKNKDSQYLTKIKPSVADKIRGREKMSGKDRQQFEEVEQVDELSTDTYHSAAKKAAKRAMGDVQGRSGPIFKKYAGMANKFRDKGMSQEKKEKAMKEEVVDEAYGSNVGKTATGTKWSDNSVSVSVHHGDKKHVFTGKHDYVAKKLKDAHGMGMHQVNFKKASDMKEATDPRDSLPQTYRPNDTTPYSRDRLATRMPSNPKDSKPKKAGRLLGLKSSIKDALGKHGPKGKLPEETIDEVLTKSTTAGETISDFVHSKNPKFAGKSKEKRKQMALAAYYAKQNEEAVNEISDKLALSYAKGASKSMDAAAAKGSAGHETFMKRNAGHALALDKTNPEHKRLKAKVGTSDANAKDAAYKKAIGEAILPGTFVEPSDSAKSKAKQIQQKDADNAALSRAKMGITEKMDDTQKAAVRAAQNWRQKTGTAKPSISDTKRTIGFIKKNSVAKEETDPGFKEGHVPDHQPKLAPKDASTMSKVAAMMAKERESFRQKQAGNTAKLVAANKSGKDS